MSDADMDIRLLARHLPEIHDGAARRQFAMHFDIDMEMARRDDAGLDDLCDGARIVQRRAAHLIDLVVPEREEVEQVRDDDRVPCRRVSRSCRACAGVMSALCVTSRPIIVSGNPALKTMRAASGST